ncbi:MAG TPA: nucleotidyltransferase family protein [Gemmatimonadaceae bacterium]|nr:nucleotidyltransferase family protein [Gemmatimonadaceae bacterium]
MIAAIVLAAGASRRFGAQKLLAELHGKPVIRWTVEHMCDTDVDDVIVVVGRERDRVRESLDGLSVRFVVNEQFASGLSASMRAGVHALTADASAAIIALGDQPTVGCSVVDSLIESYRRTGKPIVAPHYRGVRGNPVLFDASLFSELGSVLGDFGARELIGRDPARVATVELECDAPEDVDTVEELERLAEKWVS